MADRAYLERLSRDLVDAGKIIEAGWIGLRLAAIPLGAPAAQLDEMRNAFFAGAQHLFASILAVLEPGDDPTDSDLRRLDLIRTELDRFIRDFEMRHTETKGTA